MSYSITYISWIYIHKYLSSSCDKNHVVQSSLVFCVYIIYF